VTRVVVTGANRGLGLALVRQFVKRGAEVIGGCRNPQAAVDLHDAGAEVQQLDVGDSGSITAFATAVADRPVDVLFNNAGIDARAVGAADAHRGALDLSEEQFRAVLDVNTLGPWLMAKALAENLIAAGGTIVNVSSQVGSIEVAHKMGRDISYTTSKAALNMITLKESQVLQPLGVTVISLHPGWVRSEMGGPTATLDPDVAAASIADLVDRLTLESTGSFFQWDGAIHPW